jgi:hypothetical protein
MGVTCTPSNTCGTPLLRRGQYTASGTCLTCSKAGLLLYEELGLEMGGLSRVVGNRGCIPVLQAATMWIELG